MRSEISCWVRPSAPNRFLIPDLTCSKVKRGQTTLLNPKTEMGSCRFMDKRISKSLLVWRSGKMLLGYVREREDVAYKVHERKNIHFNTLKKKKNWNKIYKKILKRCGEYCKGGTEGEGREIERERERGGGGGGGGGRERESYLGYRLAVFGVAGSSSGADPRAAVLPLTLAGLERFGCTDAKLRILYVHVVLWVLATTCPSRRKSRNHPYCRCRVMAKLLQPQHFGIARERRRKREPGS